MIATKTLKKSSIYYFKNSNKNIYYFKDTSQNLLREPLIINCYFNSGFNDKWYCILKTFF